MRSEGEHWEDASGMTPPVRLVRDAMPTSRHAAMFFRMVQDLLGRDAYVESADDGKRLVLFRRARSGETDYVPWPLVSFGIGGRLSHIVMLRGPEEGSPPPAQERRPPRVRNLGPGEVMVHDGPDSITVSYGEDGCWFETSRSANPRALAGVVAALEPRTARVVGLAVELLAEYVAGLDPERHGPATVIMPVCLPGALRGVYGQGLRAIRHALFHGRVPDDARWVATDGYDGIALAWGDSRNEVLERWRNEVERLRPVPRRRKESQQPEAPPGAITISAPRADGERPEPAPKNTPAVVVPLEPLPRGEPPFGAWTRLLGRYGATAPAGLRRDVAGFTLVGDKLLETLGPNGLARLDEALAQVPPLPDFPEISRPGIERNSRTTFYRIGDEQDGLPAATIDESVQCAEFDPGLLDADIARRRIVRHRWRDLE